MLKRLWLTLILSGLGAAPAAAHLDPAEHGSLAAGLSHPLWGGDHILAMVAVGLWAALLGGPARLAVPAAFVFVMTLGFGAAMAGLPLPLVEPVILASVVALGLLAAAALRVSVLAAAIVVACFAYFHGHAHGAELGQAGALPFMVGFVCATAALHAAGIGIGAGLTKLFGGGRGRLLARAVGGATALAGVWLAVGA